MPSASISSTRTASSLQEATYTTCPVDNDDWFLKVDDLDIDRTRNVGTARNATLQFLGTPILYTPWMDFSLNNERKSGVLAPTVGITERSGIDITVPYYLNLAPNYDATLFPRLLTKRGVLLGVESRFLLDNSHGVNSFEVLPNDRVADDSRWSVALNDEYRLNANTRAGMTVDPCLRQRLFSRPVQSDCHHLAHQPQCRGLGRHPA